MKTTYIAILDTHYRIFAVGETKDEALNNLLKGYKKHFPGDRKPEKPLKTGMSLIDYYGGTIQKVENGYASE